MPWSRRRRRSAAGNGRRSICVGPEHTYLEDHPGHWITVVVTDDDGVSGHGRAGHTVHHRHPIVHQLLVPIDPVAVGETVHASIEFSDPGVLDTHSAESDWGDGTTSAAIIEEADGIGTATRSHVHPAPGLYTLTVTLVDDDTGSATTRHEHVKSMSPGLASSPAPAPSIHLPAPIRQIRR